MKSNKFLNILVFSGVIFLLLSCINAKEQKQTPDKNPDTVKTVMDTLIHSFPMNYIKSLDTVDPSRKIEIGSYKDVLELFDKHNYTPEAWQAGIREVPRAFLTIIGERWGSKTTKEITVQYKKRLFFRGLAPIILYANELIMKDRSRFEELRSSFQKKASITEQDRIWIQKLARLYKINTEENLLDESVLNELSKRVDIIPVSLALAQGAEESGWGTSRFATSGNAIYGQWTWGDNAIIPKEQRTELGNYGIAAFESIQESVCAYMLNINTHNAYTSLRERRDELREKGEKITGTALAEKLDKYSERGADYVESLKSLMDYNHLGPADDAYLSDAPSVYLILVPDKNGD